MTDEQFRALGYFTRDLREMTASAFFREGHHKIDGSGMSMQTTVGDEELRSFVTIFRRLYMENEPGNFIKALVTFGDAFAGYPITKRAMAHECTYRKELDQPPGPVPFPRCKDLPFTQRRLIDVFVYTQYAHQPDERRERQYREWSGCRRRQKGLACVAVPV